MDRIVLKKCPFCGRTPEIIKNTCRSTNNPTYTVRCTYCEATGKSKHSFYYPDEVKTDKEAIDEVINYWNNRIT